jgi:hypothetical protein
LRFFQALLEGCVETDTLSDIDNPSHWLVVYVCPGVWLYFELLGPWTDSLGRIVAAITQSSTYHVAIAIDPETAPASMLAYLQARVGWPYDLEGALSAWKNSGYHTPHHEFCSGWAYEDLQVIPTLPTIDPYPNPGKLFSQVTGKPVLLATPVEVTQADLDWLDSLPTERLATGTKQEVQGVLQS